MIIIEKLRLYLETTVFNYYFDEDRLGHEDVLRLFEAIKSGKYKAYTSKYVVQELENAQEPKRSKRLRLIEKYKLETLISKPEAEILGEIYIEKGIIPASHLFDSVHVAIASVYELDCIISYNFHHINRDKTRILATIVNNEEGYGGINIATAEEVLIMSDRFYETFEDELDAIRVNLYEKVKHMTADERITHLDEQTAPVMEEFGIQLSTLKPVQPRKRERVAF